MRVLRVLAFAREPIGRTTVARRAELNPSGVRRTLDQLAELGIVEAIGSGRNQSVKIRDQHPLADAVRSLFETERDIFDDFTATLRRALDRDCVPARALWIENPEARSPGTVHVGVLARPDRVDQARQAVEEQLEDSAGDLATHFVVHAYTDADRAALAQDEEERLDRLTLVYGWLPQEWREPAGGPVRSHRLLDERARRLGREIADLLPNDPSIVDRAMRWIDDRIEIADERETRTLREWRRILADLSIQQIQALLSEDSERADRLRQSLPFVNALTPEERSRLLWESEQ